MDGVLNKLGQLGLIPVVKIERETDALPLAQALLDGGLPCAEITFRTAAAENAIRQITATKPDVLVGAGTVLTVEQAKKAIEAGAEFIVSPGFDPDVVDYCLERDVPVTPGVATPTEINMACKKGLRVLKFFPAEALGGVSVLKAVSAAYGGVTFIPTGGINAGNLADYLQRPFVHACGGSWIVKSDLILAGDFAEITRRTGEAMEIVAQARNL